MSSCALAERSMGVAGVNIVGTVVICNGGEASGAGVVDPALDVLLALRESLLRDFCFSALYRLLAACMR